jgi:hypothetical protein
MTTSVKACALKAAAAKLWKSSETTVGQTFAAACGEHAYRSTDPF